MTMTEEQPVGTTANRNRTVRLVAIGVVVVVALAVVMRLRSDSTPLDVTAGYVRSQPGPQPLFDVPVEFGAGLHIENGKLAGGPGDAASQATFLAGSQSQLLRQDLNGDGFDELIVNLTVAGQEPGFFIVQSFEQKQRVVLQGRGTMTVSGATLTQLTVSGAVLKWKAEADSAGRIFGFGRAG